VRHLRLKVHVDQLADYVYDVHLADKLVLPDERKALVRLLIDLRAGGFQDIVKGKGGGAVVLLAGPPGTGKTLTAEVFAETEGGPVFGAVQPAGHRPGRPGRRTAEDVSRGRSGGTR
jgi:DNA polymerase III delta prime subunit